MQTTILFKTLSAAMLAMVLAVCGGQKDSALAATSATSPTADNGAAKKETVFDTAVGDFGDIVKDQIQLVLEKKGHTVELVESTDYVRPNLVLVESELNINIFQHKPYLDNFKKGHKSDITEALQMPTAPLDLYPGKLKPLDEIKDGSGVPAPSDPSNFARALVMLNELGWVKLEDGVNPLTVSKTDIAENSKNIKIIELEVAQLPRNRADAGFAVVNGSYATDSSMKLTEALFQEPNFAYVNWAAVKTADKDDQWFKDVTEAYSSDGFKTYARRRFGGYRYPAAWDENAAADAKAEAASTASVAK